MRLYYSREDGWDIDLDLTDADPVEIYMLGVFGCLPAAMLLGVIAWFIYRLLGGS